MTSPLRFLPEVGIAGVQETVKPNCQRSYRSSKSPFWQDHAFWRDVTKSSPRQILNSVQPTSLRIARLTGWCCPSRCRKPGPVPITRSLREGRAFTVPCDPEECGKLIQDFDIRTPNAFTSVDLSGGNQQKVIIAQLSRPIKFWLHHSQHVVWTWLDWYP